MKLFRKLQRRYDNLNIQTKFTLAILLAVIIPILTLAIAFLGRLYDMIIADTIRSEQEASAKTVPQIEAAIKEITGTCDLIAQDNYYHTLFGQPIQTSLTELAQTQEAWDFSKYISELTANDVVTAVRIYLDIPGQDTFYASESAENLFLPMSCAKGTYWYGIFQGSRISSLYCPPFYLGPKELERYGDSAYITSTTAYYKDTSYPCYIAVYYDSGTLKKILSDGIAFHGGLSYIINERESLIAATDDYLASTYRLSYTDIRESLLSSNNFIEQDILEEKIYAGFYYIKDPGWLMVTVLPRQPLMEKGNLAIFKFICICFVCILAAAAIAIRQSRSITTRISSVVHQMTQIKVGPPVPMPAPLIQDEVGKLMDTYNYMTGKMNLLIERQKKTSEELRIAEFNSLQAQINPHFLYNTMDMINWMALAGNTAQISNAVQNLARFYKLTLSRKKNISTIADELEHVSIYVQLQNMRYQNAIDFVLDIPDTLSGYSIPRLTLQPIVENAILHGILEKEEKTGTIVITGWLEHQDIILLVSDDGIGIPADKLPLILSEDNTGHSKGTNIAIYNIHKRLKLLYGPSYGLSYTSTQEQGTDVKISLPTHSTHKKTLKTDDTQNHSDSFFANYHLSTIVDTADPLHDKASSQVLLAHCQKLQRNTLTLENLTETNRLFPKDEDLCLLYHRVTADFPLHNHAFYELSYVCEGSVIMLADNDELLLTEGSMIILNTAAVHAIRYHGTPATLLNICIHPELQNGILQNLISGKNIISDLLIHKEKSAKNYLFLALSFNPKYAACLTDMLESYILYDYHASLELTSLLLYFFSMLVCSESYRFHGTDEHTWHMAEYIRTHANCTPEQAARHFRCSPKELHTQLLTHTGRSFSDFQDE